MSKQLKTSVLGGRRHLAPGLVHYSTIWSGLQKLRLLISCLSKVYAAVSTTEIRSQRVIGSFQEGRRQQMDLSKSKRNSCFNQNLPPQNPKAVRGPVPSCSSPNSASFRGQFTLTLCCLLALTHQLDLLPHSRFKYQSCHQVKPVTKIRKHVSVVTVPSDLAARGVSLHYSLVVKGLGLWSQAISH